MSFALFMSIKILAKKSMCHSEGIIMRVNVLVTVVLSTGIAMFASSTNAAMPADNNFGSNSTPSIVSEVEEPKAQVALTETRTMEPVIVETNRVIRPAKYSVKEVIIAPTDQIKRVNTSQGTKVAIESKNRTLIVGEEADADVVNNTEINQTFPVNHVLDDTLE